MVAELIRQAKLEQGCQQARCLQGLGHSTASATHDGTLFNGDEHLVCACHFEQQLGVQGLGPAHIDHGRVERLCGLQNRIQQRAKDQDRHACAVSPDLTFAKWQGLQPRLYHHPGARTARVTHRHGMVLGKGCAQQLAALVLIGRAGHADIGDAAQIGDVISAGMGGAVGADQASTVERKHHRQVLNGDIVDQLVIGPLQKS